MNQKIICIGLNKTGTTSLHEAFRILGLKSVHFKDDQGSNIKDIIRDNYLAGVNILNKLEHYDAISDWDRAPYTIDIIKEFYKQYPDSKFLLNSRDLNSWLDSREKHVRRNQQLKQKNRQADITWLKIDRKNWEIEYKNHYSEAVKLFKGREEQLLYFDVTLGDGWEKLCSFLELPIPTVPFPFKNAYPKKKNYFKKLFK